MTHYKFKRLAWAITIFIVNLIIAAAVGYANDRWFEVLAGIYIAVAGAYIYFSGRK